IRAQGVTPATIALHDGHAIVGAGDMLLERLASEDGVAKASLRDLGPVLAARTLGATTVAATVDIAARAGVQVVATGGIGGVHRGFERSLDESADLEAIAHNPVCVVSAGAKLVLDLALTLERLETLGVPVVGYGTDEFPAFYVRSSGLPLAHRVNDALGAARIAKEQLARGAGMLVAVPIPAAASLDHDESAAGRITPTSSPRRPASSSSSRSTAVLTPAACVAFSTSPSSSRRATCRTPRSAGTTSSGGRSRCRTTSRTSSPARTRRARAARC